MPNAFHAALHSDLEFVMANASPSVSIVIPCLNEEKFIIECLQSAVGQEGFGPHWEVLVLDGMSTDNTQTLVREFSKLHKEVRLIENPGRIQAKAINIALKEAIGEFLVRMDSHAIYAPDYVSECLNTHRDHPSTNVGGPTRTKWENSFQHAAALAFHHPFTAGSASSHDVNYEGEVDSVFMGCWRRQELIDLGGFDEEFVRNEDDELNLRIISRGGRIWQSPAICFWYYPRTNIRHLWQQQYQYGYWKPAVMKKHNKPAKLRHLIPAMFVCFIALWPIILVTNSILIYIWLLISSVYFLSLSLSTFTASKGLCVKIKLNVWLIMATYHLAYGLGSWAGFWHFMIKGRNAAQASQRSLKVTR